MRQGARARAAFLPMPYMSRQPTTCARPFMVIQQPMRVACSRLRYQMLDSVTKAGLTAPSAAPSRKRVAAKPANEVGAARHMQMAPQTMMVAPTRRTSGRRDIR